MCEVIDFRTRKKWPGARANRRPARGAAQAFKSREAETGIILCRGQNGFEPIGEIADRVVRQLRTR